MEHNGVHMQTAVGLGTNQEVIQHMHEEVADC